MANTIYNRFLYNCIGGVVNLAVGQDTIKVGLLNSVYSIDKDHDVWSDVSANEVSGTGYTAGGATLANQSITQDDTNDKAVFDGDNVTWSGASLTGAGTNAPHYAVVYDVTATSNLICVIDFGEDKPCDGGDFQILWHADGILSLAQA